MPVIVSGLTPEEAEYVRYHARKVRPLSHAEMSRKSTAVRHIPFAGWRVVHDPLAISMVPVPGWVAPRWCIYHGGSSAADSRVWLYVNGIDSAARAA